MKTIKVSLNSIDKVKQFVNDINRYSYDFDLVSGRYVIDAKSIMGIFSLDLSQPIDLNIHAEGADLEEVLKTLSVGAAASRQPLYSTCEICKCQAARTHRPYSLLRASIGFKLAAFIDGSSPNIIPISIENPTPRIIAGTDMAAGVPVIRETT